MRGLFNSVLWVSVGRYIHNACHQYNGLERKGYYYGIFNTIFCSSNIISALVVTFGLKLLSHKNYFILVTGIGLFSFVFAVFFIKNIKEPEEKSTFSDLSLKEILIATFRYYPTMISILGMIFIDGINIGIGASTLTHLIPKTNNES